MITYRATITDVAILENGKPIKSRPRWEPLRVEYFGNDPEQQRIGILQAERWLQQIALAEKVGQPIRQ